MKFRAKSLITFLAAFISLILIGVIGLSMFGGPWQRAIVVAALEAGTGAKFEVDDEFSVSIGRSLSLTAKKIRFDFPNINSTGHLRHLRVSVDTKSLVFGPLVINQLTARSGRISTVIGVEGKGEGKGHDAYTGKADDGAKLPLILQLEILDSRFDVIDEKTDQQRSFLINELSASHPGKGQHLTITGTGEADEVPWKIDGTVGLLPQAETSGSIIPVSLVINASEGEATITGTLIDIFEDARIDLAIELRAVSGGLVDKWIGSTLPQDLKLDAKGRLRGPLTRPQLQEFHATGRGADSFIKVTGRIGDLHEVSDIAASFSGRIEGGYFLRRMFGEAQKLAIHQIQGSGTISGSIKKIQLSNLKIAMSGKDGIRASVAGQLSFVDEPGGYAAHGADLKVKADALSTQVIGEMVNTRLPELGAVTVVARLMGRDSQLSVEDINLEIGKGGSVWLRIVGRIPRLVRDLEETLKRADLGVEFSADNSTDLSPLFGTAVRSLGPVTGRSRLKLARSTLEFSSFEFDVGRAGGIRLHADGNIRVPRQQGGVRIGHFDFVTRVVGGTLTEFADLLDLELPELGPIRGTVQLEGTLKSFSARSIDFEIGTSDQVMLGVTGQIERVDLNSRDVVGGVDLRLKANTRSAAPLARLTGIDLPELGPIYATASLSPGEQSKKLKFSNINVVVGDKTSPAISLAGTFSNALHVGTGELNATVLLDCEKLQPEFSHLPLSGLGQLVVNMEVAVREGGLQIKHLLMNSKESNSLRLKLNGVIDDFRNLDGVTISLDFTAPDAGVFGKPLQELVRLDQRLHFDGKVILQRPKVQFEGNLQLGDNELYVSLTGSETGTRPSVSGQLTAKRLDLADLHPAGGNDKPSDGRDLRQSADRAVSIFTTDPIPFERLLALDADLVIKVNEVFGLGQSFEELDARVRLQDGQLTISPAKLSYVGGATNFAVVIDATQKPPLVELKLSGDNFNIEQALLGLKKTPLMQGELHADIQTQSRGGSGQELVENFSGTVEFAIDKANIKGIDLHVLSDNTLDYLFSLPNLSSHTEIRCALAQFDILDGVATSRTLLIVTPRMTLSGSGLINLKAMNMDIQFAADSKSLIPSAFKKPLRIHGPLADPEVSSSASRGGLIGELFGSITSYVAGPFLYAPINTADKLVNLLREPGSGSACLEENPKALP